MENQKVKNKKLRSEIEYEKLKSNEFLKKYEEEKIKNQELTQEFKIMDNKIKNYDSIIKDLIKQNTELKEKISIKK